MIRADDGSLSRRAMIAGVKANAMLSIELMNLRAAFSPVPNVWIIPILLVSASSAKLPTNIVVEITRTILVMPAK